VKVNSKCIVEGCGSSSLEKYAVCRLHLSIEVAALSMGSLTMVGVIVYLILRFS
jgi:hypothetical protein